MVRPCTDGGHNDVMFVTEIRIIKYLVSITITSSCSVVMISQVKNNENEIKDIKHHLLTGFSHCSRWCYSSIQQSWQILQIPEPLLLLYVCTVQVSFSTSVQENGAHQ